MHPFLEPLAGEIAAAQAKGNRGGDNDPGEDDSESDQERCPANADLFERDHHSQGHDQKAHGACQQTRASPLGVHRGQQGAARQELTNHRAQEQDQHGGDQVRDIVHKPGQHFLRQSCVHGCQGQKDNNQPERAVNYTRQAIGRGAKNERAINGAGQPRFGHPAIEVGGEQQAIHALTDQPGEKTAHDEDDHHGNDGRQYLPDQFGQAVKGLDESALNQTLHGSSPLC